MNIIIVGRGELAQAIAKRCLKEKIAYSYWDKKNTGKKSVVLYCGSGRQFKEVFEYCSKNKTPLILLSTNIANPSKTSFPFLVVPNASLEVQEFMRTVINFADTVDYTKVSIVESHQQNKKDISGTALLVANKLGKTKKIITSIRNPREQLNLGIPKQYLNGHAYHKVSFTHDSVRTEFSVLVLGRETYAKGALSIAREICK